MSFAFPVGALWLLWYLYLIVIGLYRAHLLGRLSWPAKVLGSPALVVGWLLDWFINWTIAAVWFQEMPHAPLELVTDRLQRYMAGLPGRNQKHARSICAHLLDPFDPNPEGHCSGQLPGTKP